MIKIEQVDKEKNNNYFVVYKLGKYVHTTAGTAKEILEYFKEAMKEKNVK
jgi:formaldehyde-activating enzyme involved in methanogenesis